MILRVQFFSYQKIYPVNFCLQASIAPVSLPGNPTERQEEEEGGGPIIYTKTQWASMYVVVLHLIMRLILASCSKFGW